MDRGKIGAIFAVMGACIFWGLSFLSIKVTVVVLAPMALALARLIFASLVLALVVRITGLNTNIDKKDFPRLALGGFLGITIYFFFQNNGIKLISASATSIIIGAIPILALIAETIVFKTKLTPKKIISVLLSFIGVYIIVGFGLKNSSSPNTALGYLMMLGAAISWVMYCVVTNPLFEKYSQLSIIYYQSIFGTIFLIPFGIFSSVKWQLLDSGIVLNVFFLGAFCSAAAYYLYASAMNRLGVAVTSMFLNLVPVVTIIGSYFLLNEKMGIQQLFGGALIIFSVFLVNMEKPIIRNVIEKNALEPSIATNK